MKSIMDYIKTESPFENVGITAEDYMPIDDVLGKKIVIMDVMKFENEKGEGLYILFEIGDEMRYICTHAIGLVRPFDNIKVVNVVRDEGLEAVIVKRKSMKSDRMVYAFA